jgi:hypothetical protein
VPCSVCRRVVYSTRDWSSLPYHVSQESIRSGTPATRVNPRSGTKLVGNPRTDVVQMVPARVQNDTGVSHGALNPKP